ncbi:MAG TPA: alpha/beta hydrolase [Flavobacteriales bacterium]|jgi:pimeloyl-ACP methyl ester carboxylesterase|nr:alpha/beta hydrolase [Flavobacteriales bacterium]
MKISLFILLILSTMTESTAQSTPKWLDTTLYPFQGKFMNLSVGRMHYLDEGTGETVVMLHGNPGWSFEYREVTKELSKTHRCIVPDLIGFGLSDKPKDWTYLPKDHAAVMEEFLDNLNLDSFTLVVNDWGGPIGLNYAIRHPEKIKKLVILNTWLWDVSDDKHYRKFSNMMGKGVGKFMTKHFNLFGKVVVKQAMGEPKKLDKKVHQHYYKHMENSSERKGCYTFPREIIGSSQWLDSLWQQHTKINRIPTTFVWGMKDIAFRPQELDYWVEHWPDAGVTKLENVGHFPQEEAPQIVLEAILE